ncbi:cytochrome c oxidase assembly factor 7 homolog [Trichogramma pretiosum]|uniref:cytochrome c oxidase assembly factor 7 homolog n=1 Tax=Trichogramma pretiosum TaxID=7493 RepID=UPI0006C9C096|nr:cytochrome c oxidase assembly factor 7 homolog [Trichogramma pretiosum]
MAGYDLKSEEDVKLYLKNLLTEYTYGCYGEKNPEVCHLLGDYHEAVKADPATAADIYQKNCDNMQYGRSCAKIGGWKLVGRGCEKNVQRGYDYLKQGCELGDSIGCTNAGIVALVSKEIHKADKAAAVRAGVAMLQKACNEHKDQKGCFFLSGVYLKGIEGCVKRDLVEGYKVSLKACELGSPYACFNIAKMHERGEGAQKSDKLAETFKARGRELEKQIKENQPTISFGQGIDP